jgi:hypothetical protein
MARGTSTGKRRDPSLGRTIFDDIRHAELKRDYLHELRELYYFYLDDESRARLEKTGRVWRSFLLLGWILKSLYLKLSRPRRILLLVSMVLVLMGPTSFDLVSVGVKVSADLRPWGYLILLIVLMLELKDKLVAKDEIAVARQVQLALLPRTHPDLPGWSLWSYSRPANDVGGDLVDYVEMDGFRHGVLLGDVAGKGLGAALLCSKLQATIRALVPDAESLEDLAHRVNTILYRDGLDNRYATLFYAEIEYNSGQMRWVNAGHNPAFIIRSDGSEELHSSSFPVGMMDDASYSEGSAQLQPGDMLLAYSDGLTEAERPDGAEFGLDRIKQLIPELRALEPEEVGKRILGEVERFLGEDGRVGDDLSLIVVLKR